MAVRRLDPRLLSKVAEKIGKPTGDLSPVRIKVSKFAAKHSISSEAALVLIAKDLGLGTANFQRTLPASVRDEVRDTLPSLIEEAPRKPGPGKGGVLKRRQAKAPFTAAVDFVLRDEDLRSRCRDLLLGRKPYDRAVNQATLVLEDRLRTLSKPTKKLVGVGLASYAINANPGKSVLLLSSNQEEQEGFADIVRGLARAFRNRTHHHISTDFSREEALRVCGFIDVLLSVIDDAKT